MDNGLSDPDAILVDAPELAVLPEDDGFHIADYNIGDFEWWYFDIFDQVSGCFLKIVVHIGTNPLKTKIFPQLAVSVNTPEGSVSFSHSYSFSEMSADTQHCNISFQDKIKIWSEFDIHPEYFIKIDIPRLKCDFRFIGEIEGWKPLGNKIHHQIGGRKGSFSWIIPVPKARVEGVFLYENKKYTLQNAIGYHDHNYYKVGRNHPLHLDDLVIKWIWGKCYADRFTMIFMDTQCRTNRILSLMIAESNEIILSSNNLVDCSVVSFGYDNLLHVKYPTAFRVKSNDERFLFKAELECNRLLDRKDLLEGVNPIIKMLIKNFFAKPAYHGILAKVKFRINDNDLEGSGNYESMVFRER